MFSAHECPSLPFNAMCNAMVLLGSIAAIALFSFQAPEQMFVNAGEMGVAIFLPVAGAALVALFVLIPKNRPLDKAPEKAAESPAPNDEKIAVVGMACRIPGASSLEEMWDMLWNGRDGTSEIPESRFDVDFFHHDHDSASTNKMITRRGGIVHDIYRFDHEFWRIPKEEAMAMNPAVRVLLEVTYEALCDAGLSRDAVAGTKCGVFMGSTGMDWGNSQASALGEDLNKHNNVGTNACMTSNRISYEFDLRGPSFTVDTASSGSLYSLYLARQSLLAGDCDIAIAGGVNTLLAPTEIVAFTAAQMLSPDGRCKSFDERADGFVKGEGAAVVVLVREEYARSKNMPAYAAIRGGAVNHNGRTHGIQTPSVQAQKEMIEQALVRSHTRPEEVGYIEAHGTGTKVGDRIEAEAIGLALGRKRLEAKVEHPLQVGSLKSNIGHLFGGAGAAAFVKVALMLHERTILPMCSVAHARKSREIDWTREHLEPATSPSAWPGDPTQQAVACLSGYGFGGANGHLVLESCEGAGLRARVKTSAFVRERCEQKDCFKRLSSCSTVKSFSRMSSGSTLVSGADTPRASARVILVGDNELEFVDDQEPTPTKTPPHYQLLSLSGKSAQDVSAMCIKAASRLRSLSACAEEASLEEVLASFNLAAQRHAARCTVFGTNALDIADALQESSRQRVDGVVASDAGRGLVLVFSGMGTQWAGMGAQLLDECPSFLDVIREVDHCLANLNADFSVETEMRAPAETSRINNTDVAQPAIFAVQAAILAFLRLHGVRTEAVIGHSVGEIGACFAAGRLTLADAVRVAFARGQLLSKHAQAGKMIALIDSSLQAATSLIERLALSDQVQVAAKNSPSSIVLSGTSAAVDEVARECEALKVTSRVLRVERAFHSRFVDDAREPLLKMLDNMQSLHLPTEDCPPIVSTVDGKWVTGEEVRRFATAEYWWMNTRSDVNFEAGVRELLKGGYCDFLEVSPSAHLLPHIAACAAASKQQKRKLNLIPTLQPPSSRNPDLKDQTKSLFKALATLQSTCHDLALVSRSPSTFVPLPPYPWAGEETCQVGSFWRTYSFPMEGVGSGPNAERHLLLGKRMEANVWEGQMKKAEIPWCIDHALQKQIIIPGAGLIETALQAATEMFEISADRVVVEDVHFKKTFNLGADGFLPSKVVLSSVKKVEDVLGGALATAEVFGVGETGAELHCTASVRKLRASESGHATETRFSMDEDTSGCQEMDGEEFYAVMSEFAQLQGAFQGISHAWYRGQEHLVVKIEHTESVRKDYARGFFNIHPAHLDAVVQIAGVALIGRVGSFAPMIPFSVGKFHMAVCPPPASVFAKAIKVEMNAVGMLLSVDAFDEHGNFVFTLTDLQLKALRPAPTLDDVMLWSKKWIAHEGCDVRPWAAPRAVAVLGRGEMVRIMREELGRELSVVSCAEEASTIVYVAGMDDCMTPGPALYEEMVEVVALYRQFCEESVEFVLVTAGGQDVLGAEDETAPNLTALWGLVYNMKAEVKPERMSIRMVDIPRSSHDELWRESAQVLRRLVVDNSRATSELALRVVDGRLKAFECRLAARTVGEENQAVEDGAWTIAAPTPGAPKTFRPLVKHLPSQSAAATSAADVTLKATSTLTPSHVCLMPCGSGSNPKSVWLACASNPPTLALMPGAVDPHLTLPTDTSITVPAVQHQRELLDHMIRVAEYAEAAYVYRTAAKLMDGSRVMVVVDRPSRRSLSILNLLAAVARRHALTEPLLVAVDSGADGAVAAPFERFNAVSLQSEVLHQRLRLHPVDLLVSLTSAETTSLLLEVVAEDGSCLFVSPDASGLASRSNVAVRVVDAASAAAGNLTKLLPAVSTVLELAGDLPLLCEYQVLSATAAAERQTEQGDAAVVVDISARGSVKVPLDLSLPHFQASDGAAWQVITGGHKGLGLQLARWLVEECGARALVLVGSSQQMPDETAAWARAQEQEGVTVVYKSCDVTQYQQVHAMLAELRESGRAVGGVFHLAVMYDDKALGAVRAVSDVSKLFGAKAEGAWNLHEALVELGLEPAAFVMASSIATIISSAGQSVYVAANSYLEGLAALRRQQGRAGAACCMGLVGDAGFADRERWLVRAWESRGIKAMSARQLCQGLGFQLASGAALLGVTSEVRFPRQSGPSVFAEPQTLTAMVRQRHFSRMFGLFTEEWLSDLLDEINNNKSVVSKVAKAEDREEQLEVLQQGLVLAVEELMQISADTSTPLVKFGLDSLQAVRLIAKIEALLEGKYRPSELQILNDATTVTTLSVDVLEHLLAEEE